MFSRQIHEMQSSIINLVIMCAAILVAITAAGFAAYYGLRMVLPEALAAASTALIFALIAGIMVIYTSLQAKKVPPEPVREPQSALSTFIEAVIPAARMAGEVVLAYLAARKSRR